MAKVMKGVHRIASTLLVIILSLIAIFIITEPYARAGVLVPPPKLIYKYNPKYRNPFDPSAEKKVPEPPDKYPVPLKETDFFKQVEKLNQTLPKYKGTLFRDAKPVGDNTRRIIPQKGKEKVVEVTRLPNYENLKKRNLMFAIVIFLLLLLGIIGLSIYLRYQNMVRIVTTPAKIYVRAPRSRRKLRAGARTTATRPRRRRRRTLLD